MGQTYRVHEASNVLSQEGRTNLFFLCCFCVVWALCLVSAIAVVYTTYKTRELTRELEALRAEAIDLRVTSGQYQLERSALGSYSRVETIAKENLQMSSPQAEDTVLVVKE